MEKSVSNYRSLVSSCGCRILFEYQITIAKFCVLCYGDSLCCCCNLSKDFHEFRHATMPPLALLQLFCYTNTTTTTLHHVAYFSCIYIVSWVLCRYASIPLCYIAIHPKSQCFHLVAGNVQMVEICLWQNDIYPTTFIRYIVPIYSLAAYYVRNKVQ